ncbi:hypothetical protein [Gloeobacter kilaueensis]|uniref:Uncharacterized protein n=1 Tax=Gloeobacter kilaueensis (strain ATCC BAA-2537 / CCAP 1431/1 / ULC 316 / JS1) TaxID=1183438 RepID=U5QHM8_GLOK1|nr:hypothetical protein [Gloeobacter kilaueensis]AGY58368.1 hypothetical protein GKIL_2122 [Gloeobacter kilaueensis JS1]
MPLSLEEMLARLSPERRKAVNREAERLAHSDFYKESLSTETPAPEDYIARPKRQQPPQAGDGVQELSSEQEPLARLLRIKQRIEKQAAQGKAIPVADFQALREAASQIGSGIEVRVELPKHKSERKKRGESIPAFPRNRKSGQGFSSSMKQPFVIKLVAHDAETEGLLSTHFDLPPK